MKAFPTHKEEGMELRDYFAAKAMQGLIESKIVMDICESSANAELPEIVAIMAYDLADLMMKAREK